MLSTKRIIGFFVLFFASYMACYYLYKQSYFGKVVIRSFQHRFNNNLSEVFQDTRMFAQALNSRPLDCKIHKANFSLNGQDPVENLDMSINFINSKSLIADINTPKDKGPYAPPNLDLQFFKFSIWNFFVLPFTILLSLWIASLAILSVKLRNVFYSFLTLLLLLSIELASLLIRMRSEAEIMEPFDLSKTFISMNNAFNGIVESEFTYISTSIIFILFAYKQFIPLFQSIRASKTTLN